MREKISEFDVSQIHEQLYVLFYNVDSEHWVADVYPSDDVFVYEIGGSEKRFNDWTSFVEYCDKLGYGYIQSLNDFTAGFVSHDNGIN